MSDCNCQCQCCCYKRPRNMGFSDGFKFNVRDLFSSEEAYKEFCENQRKARAENHQAPEERVHEEKPAKKKKRVPCTLF